MHKLVILITPLENWQSFEEKWPDFLHLAEDMPGLRREATSRVEHFMFGATPLAQMHELYFDTFAELEGALASPAGQAAGKLLQEMTQGRLTLFLAEHKEDVLENILQFRKSENETP